MFIIVRTARHARLSVGAIHESPLRLGIETVKHPVNDNAGDGHVEPDGAFRVPSKSEQRREAALDFSEDVFGNVTGKLGAALPPVNTLEMIRQHHARN